MLVVHAPLLKLYDAALVAVTVSVIVSPAQIVDGVAVNAVIVGAVGTMPGQLVASVSAVIQPK
jgi:hypothetical protein